MLEKQEIGMYFIFSIILAIFVILLLTKHQLISLAWRNMLKNRRRTMILLCVIVSGLAGAMQFFGFAQNSLYNIRELTIKSGLGHIQLYKKGFREASVTDRIKYTITNYEELAQLISNEPELKPYILGISAELNFSGIVALDGKSSIFVGKGIDTAKYKLFSEADKVIDGKPLEEALEARAAKEDPIVNESEEMFEGFTEGKNEHPETMKKEIWRSTDRKKIAMEAPPALSDTVLGEGLARSLGATLGDRMTLVVSTKSGALNALDGDVRGVIRGFAQSYNDTILKIPLKYAWKLMGGTYISKMCILLKDTETTDIVHAKITQIIEKRGWDLECETWFQEAIMYKQVSNILMAFFSAISFIIGLVVIFSIANAMLMSVMERVREIGTIRALGETKGGIMQIFLTEGFMIGILGGFLAIIFGIIISLFINHVVGGIPMPPPPGGSESYIAQIRVLEYPRIWVTVFNIAVIASILSSIIPARKACNMEVATAIRYI